MSTQRRVTITTPLGDQLQFRQLVGSEELSSLFEFDIDLLSTSKSIDPKALLGKGATVVVETEGLGKRYLDGIVTRFGMQGEDHSNYSYRLQLRPWLWLATRRSDFRIFQNQTVPDILQAVLAPYGFALALRTTRNYRAWDYCVQYNETDFNFVSRLCEHEGIYWHFEHAAGHHTLVFADDVLSGHQSLPGHASIAFYPPHKSALAERECISAWELAQEVRPGAHFSDDYDFKKPRADLSQLSRQPPGHSQDSFEIYEWPGGFTQDAEGRDYLRVRMQEHLSERSVVQGESNVRGMAPGYLFNLTNYPREDQNQQYLVTGVHYHFKENAQVSGFSLLPGKSGQGGKPDAEEGSVQRLRLTAQPATLDYRPQRTTPKPRVQGIETAVVVGPAGEEIWTDQYGRIKVQFHWDRLGQNDQNSSCWMRVSAPWAGSNFDGIFIPRIGQEVIISFVGGDPDYPMVTGCVYNQNNMPPWGLPGSATQSGFLTRSSKGGAPGAGEKNGVGDANALRFEDKAGAEQLWLHAQKDQLTEVEHDEDKWVGNDRRKTVDGNETNIIHKNRTETVDQNETITVHMNRTETVDMNETILVHMNRTETVDLNESVTVHMNQTFHVDMNRSKTVGINETDSIGNNWKVTTGKMKTENIGLLYLQNTGIFKMVSIGVAYVLNVGAMMMTNVGLMRMDTVGMNWSRNAGANETVTIGADQITTVGVDQTTIVGVDQSTTIGANQNLVIGADQSITVGGAHKLEVATDSTTTAGGNILWTAGDEIVGSAKSITLSAASTLTLACGSSTIVMTSNSITMLSGKININT